MGEAPKKHVEWKSECEETAKIPCNVKHAYSIFLRHYRVYSKQCHCCRTAARIGPGLVPPQGNSEGSSLPPSHCCSSFNSPNLPLSLSPSLFLFFSLSLSLFLLFSLSLSPSLFPFPFSSTATSLSCQRRSRVEFITSICMCVCVCVSSLPHFPSLSSLTPSLICCVAIPGMYEKFDTNEFSHFAFAFAFYASVSASTHQRATFYLRDVSITRCCCCCCSPSLATEYPFPSTCKLCAVKLMTLSVDMPASHLFTTYNNTNNNSNSNRVTI